MKRVFAILFFLLLFSHAIAEDITLQSIPVLAKESYQLGEHDPGLVIIKQRFRELGYYSDGFMKERTLTEFFDIQLAQRIQKFKTFNELPVTDLLDQEMLSVLFSERALSENAFFEISKNESSFPEPLSLMIPPEGQINVDYSGDAAVVKAQVTNYSSDKSVVAFELKVLPYNAWNECIIEEDDAYTVTTLTTIKPGEKKYSNTCTIPNYKDIFDLCIGVSKFRFDNGLVIEIPDKQIVYGVWRGPFKP